LKYLALFFFVFVVNSLPAAAQEAQDSLLRARADSIRMVDSLQRVQKTKDSLLMISQQAINRAADSLRKVQAVKRRLLLAEHQAIMEEHPYFNFDGVPIHQPIEIRQVERDDSIFYFIVGLVLYIALMRLFFYKYMSTMFTLFFRATLRQQQLREQLLQAPLPALLMNIFFVFSMAAYCTFLAMHYHLEFAPGFWTTLLYAVLLVAGIYLVKFLFLNIVGWIFGISSVTDTYIFIVFLINKMIGIFLLPFIALLAFPTAELLPIVLTISYFLVGGMLFYRFIISYRPVRTEIKLNRIHFFIYLCAFEIAPLLLIYKVLLALADKSIHI